MKKATGFITLHRQIQDWEWYRNPHTAFLFIHLLLSANYVDGMFQGRLIKRGQLVTSLTNLSTGTGLSYQQARTALAHLRSTGEITDETNNQYRIITIVKYDDYQKVTDKLTGNQQATNRQPNRQPTGESQANQQQYNNINNSNKGTIEQGNNDRESAKRFIPPTLQEIRTFCQENGLVIDVDRFVDYYQSNGWKVGRNQMKDWKATVRRWAREDKKASAPVKPAKRVIAQQYEQRSYASVDDYYSAEQDHEMEEYMRREAQKEG
jgi:hypothetical protein